MEPLNQDIRLLLVLGRVRQVLPVRHFRPLDTLGADALGALGARAVRLVVDHWQWQGLENLGQLLSHLGRTWGEFDSNLKEGLCHLGLTKCSRFILC